MAPLPTDAREGRTAYDPVLLGIVVVGVIALLFLISAFVFNSEKSADVNQAHRTLRRRQRAKRQSRRKKGRSKLPLGIELGEHRPSR